MAGAKENTNGTLVLSVSAKPWYLGSEISVAVGTIITDRPRTDPCERVYAYGSYEG